ncbi:hypothetical protein WJ438_39590 [Streptomyces sp. GD-15H]|uniref:hypothetical protein n=1 Tax=Streptomyces sp. GD-15H TaxID=3129112 RepID=UPI00324DF748
MRHALSQAGFCLVSDEDDRTSGPRVSAVDAGVLVSWSVSHGFTALAVEQRAADGQGKDVSGDSMRAIVQAAPCRAC